MTEQHVRYASEQGSGTSPGLPSRYALTPGQTEPARTALVEDREGDIWRYRNGSWQLATYVADDAGEPWFALLQKYGPIKVYRLTETKEF